MAIHKHAEMAYRQVLDATKGVTLQYNTTTNALDFIFM